MGITNKIKKLYNALKSKKIIVAVFSNLNKIPIIDQCEYDVIEKNKLTLLEKLNNRKYYYIKIENEVAHSSWVFKSNLLARQLGFKGVKVIGNCYTIEKYRGRKLYGITVSFIINSRPNDKYVMFIDPCNISSINGVRKIGLESVGVFELNRFLGISYKIKKISD